MAAGSVTWFLLDKVTVGITVLLGKDTKGIVKNTKRSGKP
jgi:hypothetical protein